MKIKDFIGSSKRVKKTPTQFVLSNESKENRLENQIKEFQIELNQLSEVTKENKDLMQRASQYNSKEEAMRQEIVSLQDENSGAALEIKRLLEFQRANHGLNIQVKNNQNELDSLRGTVELAKTNNMEKDKHLSNLQTRFDVLFNEESGMRSELNQAQNKLQNQGVELAKYSKIYNETKDLLDVTQNTLRDAVK